MLDIGWWELVVVAMIALIVVGPKDLPRILRVIGQWAGKARAMARLRLDAAAHTLAATFPEPYALQHRRPYFFFPSLRRICSLA